MDSLAPADPFAVTTLDQLGQLYDPPRELVLKKVIHRLEPRARAFIAASPFAILGTVGPQGVHATPRGDAPGFIEPLDDRTLALPDRRGNNRLDALRDIIADPRVALLFLVPGIGEALRVNGTARITADPALRARFAVQGKEPVTVLLVTIEELYMQCAKSILRSKLWGERARPQAVPSMGEIIAAHTDGMVEPAQYDAEAPQRLRDTMY
ncbi:pyridoxamine 5'-phosphate oxidase family protein [Paracraurococcus ruber]|uniref:Flavin-nucleotide-binding protein n=1 Tax=Paracraurococcus ruber TaxID=77675 RepID=A0ABS1D484_9PROT|nr:pyridoxamine 5'-phosphate oxidase family protein [Paracraurococcus ruber]MBK1661673.1 flavin-nucleotide-binding protein [Paracraurococcus ruber]TDG22522.1 pyridoxamine 5'-phosphate oxidase family protein [Paracraurococcus ruber]